MSDKHWQARTLVDYLNSNEIVKLLDYCKRQFPTAYKRSIPKDADAIRAVDTALAKIKNGRPFVLKQILDEIEYDVIHRALVHFKKQTRAAEFLGLKEQTLRYKMIRLKIPTIRDNQDYYIAAAEEEK